MCPTSKFQTLFLKQWMDCLPRNYRYEQHTVVLEGGINEETGELAISKKNSEGPGPMGLDLRVISDLKMSNN